MADDILRQHIGKAIATVCDQQIRIFVIQLLNLMQFMIEQSFGALIEKGEGLAHPRQGI